MKHVKVINATTEDVDLKEGNAGIYRVVGQIKVGRSHGLNIDENATYREYVCVETKSGLSVTLTSDDLIDYKEVKIEKDGTNGLMWQKNSVKRDDRFVAEAVTDTKIGQAVEGVKSTWDRITSLANKLFKQEKKPAKSEKTSV